MCWPPLAATAQSELPNCPPGEIYMHNCVGTEDRINEKFVGEFKYYKRNGHGTSIYPNGDKYVGEFKDNKRNGQGTFTFAIGGKYVGEWADDKPNGQGTYYFLADNKFKGDKYVGEFKDGKHHGQGTYIFANGQWESGSLVQSFSLDTERFSFTPPEPIATPQAQVTDPRKAERNRSSADLEVAQSKCRELGFKPKTERFGKCVLQLSK